MGEGGGLMEGAMGAVGDLDVGGAIEGIAGSGLIEGVGGAIGNLGGMLGF